MLSVCTPELTSGVDRYRDYIVKTLAAGMCRINIYRELVIKGLKCGKTAAYNYMNYLAKVYHIEPSYMKDTTPEQKNIQNHIQQFDYISRRDVFRFLWIGNELKPEHLSYLVNTYPKFGSLYICVKEFKQIFKTKYQSLLYCFIEKYSKSAINQLAGFVKSLINDLEAVENAVSSPLSNGFVEGTNCKLKMLKRTMYGRCRRELLAAKLMLHVDCYTAICG